MARPLTSIERYHYYFLVSPSPNDAPRGIVLDDKVIPLLATRCNYLTKPAKFRATRLGAISSYVKIGDGDSHDTGRYSVHNPSFNLVHTENCASLRSPTERNSLYLMNENETDTVNPGTYLKRRMQAPGRVTRRTEWFPVIYSGDDQLKALKLLLEEFSAFLSDETNDFGYQEAMTMFSMGASSHEIALGATRKMKEMMEGYYTRDGVYVDDFVDRFKHFDRLL